MLYAVHGTGKKKKNLSFTDTTETKEAAAYIIYQQMRA